MIGDTVAAPLDATVVTGDVVERVSGIVAITLFRKVSYEDIPQEALSVYERRSKVSRLRLGAGMSGHPWMTDA